MSKVKGPLFSNKASGTVAKKMTYRNTRHGAVVTGKHFPGSVYSAPPSQLQVDRRTKFSQAAQSWGGLSSEQKEGYNIAAEMEDLTGWNLYLREFLNASGFTEKPPVGTIVNLSHSIGSRISGAWLGNGSTFDILDSSGGNNHGRFVGSTIGTRVQTIHGLSLQMPFNLLSHVQINNDLAHSGFSKCTIIQLIKNNKAGIGSTGAELTILKKGSAADAYAMFQRPNEDLVMRLTTENGEAEALIPNGIPASEMTKWNQISLRFDGLTLANNVISDNLDKEVIVPCVGTMIAANQGMRFCGGIYSDSFDGQVAYTYIFDDYLSKAELLSIWDNPWQIY